MTLKAMEEEYRNLYEYLPDTKEERLSLLAEKLTDKDMKLIQEEIERISNLEWKEIKFIIPMVPRPCPRPRLSSKSGRFYVSNADVNKKFFKKFLKEQYDLIYTQMHLDVITYLPIPLSSMNKREVYLAELGYIKPVSNPDWDNLGKSYSDMIQGLLILNDNIITVGRVEKFYSIKPRVELMLRYQLGFDSKFNKNRITKSKSYLDTVEVGCPIIYFDEIA